MDLNEYKRFRESRSLESSHTEKPVLLPKKKIIKKQTNMDRNYSHYSPLGLSSHIQPVIMEHSPRILSSNPKLKGVVAVKPDLTPTRLSNFSLGHDSSNNSRTESASKVTKHQFKLKDLPIYSKTLRFNKKKDGVKMDAFVKTVLGGKYLKNTIKEENTEDESERKPKVDDDLIS